MKCHVLIIFFLLCSLAQAQPISFPMEYGQRLRMEWSLDRNNLLSHPGISPRPFQAFPSKCVLDSIYEETIFDTTSNRFEQAFTRASLIRISKPESYGITLDPLFNFAFGSEYLNQGVNDIRQNSRGVWVKGWIGKGFSFETSLLENQILAPAYLDAIIKPLGIYPGMGRTKKFKEAGYDFAFSSGTLLFQPKSWLAIQMGHGKLFVGHGYRSLLLSDNAFNYPHVRVCLQNKWLNYQITVASLMNLNRPIVFNPNSEPVFQKKNATFHVLDVHPLPWLNVSFFQGVIWRAANPQHPYFNWNTLNPIPGWAAAQYGLEGINNVLLGAQVMVKLKPQLWLYGQLMLDGLPHPGAKMERKTGYQLGTRYYHAFNVQNLMLVLERNQVSPFSYSSSNPQQNYTHYNQSLAHPLGANFTEWVAMVDYRWKSLFGRVQLVQYTQGVDSIGFVSGYKVLASDKPGWGKPLDQNQGTRLSVSNTVVTLGYTINQYNRMELFLQLLFRSQQGPSDIKERNFLLGFRTNLWNSYTDF